MTNGGSQGLFVVVAVVIFGIFIAISYTLFRDKLTPSLSSMFEDSTFEAEYALKEIDNINSLRTEGNLTYAKLKSSNTTDSDVYVTLSKNSDGHFVIVTSSIKEGENSLFGKNIFGNDLIIPNHIDGIKIVSINESAFYNAKFKGQLILPKYLERIEKMAFF